jgi:hypothetical protein
MHTKRNRKHHYSRRRHCRSRRAGTLTNLRKSLTSAIGKTQFLGPVIDVENRPGTYDGMHSRFTGTMHKNGQYIQGNLFYERDGTRVGVHATNFDNMNRPCGTVMRIHLNGNPILDNFGRPIREYVTCDNSHIKEYPFLQ